MSSATASSKTMAKSNKKSKIITLRLSADLLAQFPADVKPRIDVEPSPSVQPPDSADKSSESNSTPMPSNANDDKDPNSLAPPPKVDGRRKRGGGTMTGRKRAPPAIDPEGTPRERGRPGPKKKPRLPDGTIDRSSDNTKVANPVPAHKLGPKANTGAINAGLRALDRSGKPCRRWERKGAPIKSFTGMMWGVPSWKAPARQSAFSSSDVKTDSTGSSEAKPIGSSALPSERSNSGNDGGDPMVLNGMESSPAPPVAA